MMDPLKSMQDAFMTGKHGMVAEEAPGRVNLIGEHTDYNGGYVLPLALPLQTRCVGVAREDNEVYVMSLTLESEDNNVSYRLGEEERTGTWIDYIQGVTHLLRKDGHVIRGFELCLSSTVPLGSGLSSSAALEVSVLRTLRTLFHLHLDDVALALLAHRVETDFVGAQIGIMDQMASSLGDSHTALFLNARTKHYMRIAFPSQAELIIMNSGITHSHAGGEYNQRREECSQAARILGVDCLSDLNEDDLPGLPSLPDPLSRRVRHVVTENHRVLETVKAMQNGDLFRMGQLFYESHQSMSRDYEVSIPEIDFLVESFKKEKGIYGARLTGGGFGGCVVILAKPGEGKEAAFKVGKLYQQQFGRPADILVMMEPG